MNLNALAAIIGKIGDSAGHDALYYQIRGCFIDARGTLEIDPSSVWGFGCRVITRGHRIADGRFDPLVVDRPVIVGARAWIGSFATLYNCRIGEGAVVAAGAVVRSCEVAPHVMVAGNPARVVARLQAGRWVYEGPKWRRLE